MDTKREYIDMHIHSNKSDGDFSAKEIVELSLKNDTTMISITDHDTINAIDELNDSLPDNMIGVNGVEFSSYITVDNQRYKIHLLGYGFDPKNKSFYRIIDEMCQKRVIAHNNLIKEVNETITTIPEESIAKLDIERYSWFDREIIKQLKEDKFDRNTIDEIKKYFIQRRFNYDKNYYLESKRVIDTIHEAGGYAVFAHPMAYGLDNEIINKIIIKLTDLGIDGIEVFQSDCSREDSNKLMKISNELGLLYSVGSDFHKFSQDGRLIGKGINDSLCITETSLSNKLIKEKKIFRR